MPETNKLKDGKRVNLWLEYEEYEYYKEHCIRTGLPFISWARSLLRQATGYVPVALRKNEDK